ncbi:MAG: adenylosuccinate synthetase [Candidatus Heimdallarchaeota archaeon]|nr:adenylosuccinate synthetase [Candidatus Heimdallarchaeota archaeon]
MVVSVVVGGFFGDEGKGKIVSHIVNSKNISIVARGGVGPNAGHTVVIRGTKYQLRMVPSGFAGKHVEKLLIGPGVLVNPEIFLKELSVTKVKGKLFCDPKCGIITEKHINQDKTDVHLTGIVGTSGSGTGPANEDRVRRSLRLAKDIPELSEYLIDVPLIINDYIEKGKEVLLEGTQATHLSLWHGTYPHVTSKDVTAAAICSDVGIGPTAVSDVIVVFKAYVTRVGSPKADKMEGELTETETQRRGWEEYGTVTGRLRRAAPFNYNLAKRSIMLNYATKIALTKLDILFPEDRGTTDYSALSNEAKQWIEEKESKLGMRFTYIGTGPSDSEIIER